MSSCYILLDHNTGSTLSLNKNSRLYTKYKKTLICNDITFFSKFIMEIQDELKQGRYAIILFNYELGVALENIQECKGVLAEAFLFDQYTSLTLKETNIWLNNQEKTKEIHQAEIINIRSSINKKQFIKDIHLIKDSISSGEVYQVNYTYRLFFETYGAPIVLYNRLRKRQQVPYGAFMNLPNRRYILSFSPELFIRHQSNLLTTQPMKGTASISNTNGEHDSKTNIIVNEKNCAENLMIVDLLRNDLSKICEKNTIRVPKLFCIKRFGKILQMTSTITGKLHKNTNLEELLTALFPCGSVTGAPKQRAMHVIQKLEKEPRHLYSGALGWFDPPTHNQNIGDFCLSVPIRTLLLKSQTSLSTSYVGEMGVGAGIIHDSIALEEYKECLLKTHFLIGLKHHFYIFETIYFNSKSGYRYLNLHLKRLLCSANYFNFKFNEKIIRDKLYVTCKQLSINKSYGVRLILHQSGYCDVQSRVLNPVLNTVKVFISHHKTSSKNIFLKHKSTIRTMYDNAIKIAQQHNGYDMLFFNEKNQLTEGGRTNVFIQLNNTWYTPPLSAGVLPGIMRSIILHNSHYCTSEKNISRTDLLKASKIILCNALRGILPTQIIWKNIN